MTTIEKLHALARELAGAAWDYDRRQLAAQAHVRREAANAVVNQADTIQREDAMFQDPEAKYDRPDWCRTAGFRSTASKGSRDGIRGCTEWVGPW